MDYHSMKRLELQALCKQHKIPANSANSVMADKLSELLNEKQKPKGRQRTCIKSPIETIDESESAVSRRQAKKVRFSPEVEYERSGKKQKAMEPVITEMKGRRKSMVKKVVEPSVDNVNTVADQDVQIPIKLTRSRAHKLGEQEVLPTKEKKQTRRAVKDVEKVPEVVKETEGNGGKVTRSSKAVKEAEKKVEPAKETVVSRARVTRSKGQTVTEDSKDHDLSPQAKKKSGKVTEKEEKVEPSKEVKDVPVRSTRSRGQTSSNDTVVANPPAEKKRTRKDDSEVAIPLIEKKRTRRDKAVADLSHNLEKTDEGKNLGNGRRKKQSEEKVAEVPEVKDNAEKGTRQSRRNKANVEDSTVLNQDESKVETVIERKATRSKALLAKKPSEKKGKAQKDSKTVQQLEEPIEEPAGRKNVNRRKSVIQPKITEPVLPLEEPVKRDTRRKSVVQKAQGKESKKPLVEKKEKVKETETPVSPKAKSVGKKQTKDASENEPEAVSSTRKNSAKKEKGSGVKTIETETENETKAVASGSGSQKTRKRKGDPVIEEETIEKTEPVSTRKNSTAKKEQISGVKTPASRKGAVSADNKSTKRAKMSEIKESYSKDNAEKAMGTPISKMANLEINDEVIETEKTPAIDESSRRFTRGAIRSDRKEPSQSAIKEQTARKTPGRFTRSGIMKQPSESTHQSQPLDVAQMASLEDAEAKSIPDETVTVPSEVPKEGDVSASDKSNTLGTPISKMANLALNDEVIETEKTPAIKAQTTGAKARLPARKTPGRVTRTAVKVDEKKQSSQQSQPLDNAQTASPEDAEAKFIPDETTAVPSEVSKEANAEILEQLGDVSASESVISPTVDSLSDGSHAQIQNQEPEESAIPEISEKETESGSTEELENTVNVEEPFVSVVKTVVIEESVEISIEQSNIKGKSQEENEASQPSLPQSENQIIEDDGVNNQMDNNDEDVADGDYAQGMDSVKEGDDVESNRAGTVEPSTDDDKIQDLDMNENVTEDEKVTVPENLTIHSEPEIEFDVVEAEKEPESTSEGIEAAKEVESDVMASTGNDVCEIPILEKSEDEDEGAENVKEHERNMNDQDGKSEQEDSAMEEQEVGDDDTQPIDNEDVAELTQVIIKSQNQESEPVASLAVDAPQSPEIKVNFMAESIPDTNTESVTIEGLESEQKATGTSEGVESKEDESIEIDLRDTQRIEENEDALVDDDKEQTDIDMRDYSNHCVAQDNPTIEETSPLENPKKEPTPDQLPGDLGAYGSPTTEEESPVDDAVSEPLTSSKNEDRDNEDWGNYSFDDFQKPVSANESDDVGDQSTKDDQTSSPAVENTTEEFVDWTDSSLKALLKTPGTTQASHAKHIQQSTSGFPLPDGDDDTREDADYGFKSIFKTPGTTQVTRAKDTQKSTVRFALPNKDDTEVKAPQETSPKTPATTQVSHVKEREQSTVRFTLPDEVQNPDLSLKTLFATPATTTQVSHAYSTQQSGGSFDDIFSQDGKQGGDVPESQGLGEDKKSESFGGVMDFEEFSSKYFDDDQVHDDGNDNDDMSSESAGTSHHHAKSDSQTAHQDTSLQELFKTPATTNIKDQQHRQNPGVTEDPLNETFEDNASKYFDNQQPPPQPKGYIRFPFLGQAIVEGNCQQL
ncbi:hypothetical protein LXL04_031224 [Taraxacum kok-saghyz]